MVHPLKKYNLSWINPFSGSRCHVAFEGATVVRVEDFAAQNTRVLYYEDLRKELMIMDDTKISNNKIISRRTMAKTGRSISKNPGSGATDQIPK